MKKLMLILVATLLLPTASLLARGAGHGGYGHDHFNRGDWGGNIYGGYGGYNGYVYPDPQSQPGMADDSDALYNSYLKTHHQGGY